MSNKFTNVYGYTRISSRDQNIDRQIEALTKEGVLEENIFIDKQSGANFDRSAYKELINTIQKGDLVLIKSIDRLGRDYNELQNQWRLITKEIGADIKILDQTLLDTTIAKDILGTFVSDLVLQILSFNAEQERSHIKQRQAEGIALAHAKGVKFGRPKRPLPDNFEELFDRYMKNESVSSLAKECDLSESTLRLRLLERLQNGKIDN